MWQQFTYRDPSANRPYFVYTPETYQPGTPVPLIVMLHGCTQSALDFAAATRMNNRAEQHHCIVVYPQQIKNYNHNFCWNWFLPAHQGRGRGEPASIVSIIQTIQNAAYWTIDPTRIYVAGISAGAAMASILAATYPDIFAALAIHSGLEYQAATSTHAAFKAMRHGGPHPFQQGNNAFTAMGINARPVPTIVFHGTHDQVVVPINGDQTVQQWMHTNTLASGGHDWANFFAPTHITQGLVQTPGGHTYTTSTWTTPDGKEVQSYWKIHGMGHAWSGGNPAYPYTDMRGPDATYAIYTFFMAHPMQRVEPLQSNAPVSLKTLPRFFTGQFTLRKGKHNHE